MAAEYRSARTGNLEEFIEEAVAEEYTIVSVVPTVWRESDDGYVATEFIVILKYEPR